MIYVNARALIYRKNASHNIEILIQRRNKPNQPQYYELPGGQVNEYESLIEALKREVKEETGLDIHYLPAIDTRIITLGNSKDFTVECIKPFAVYQTLEGPVDSMGVYFICEAEGIPLLHGDDAKEPRWVSLETLKQLIETNGAFSSIDKAGVMMYLNTTTT